MATYSSSLLDEIPHQFISIWKTSHEPWGFKDRNSRYLYANTAFFDLLNLPDEFNIEGLLDSDLPHPSFSEYASQFQEQDKLAEKLKKTVSSLETHCFGREQMIQPYLFEKFPFLNQKKEFIGVMFHGKKMQFLTGEQYVNHEPPYSILLEKPDDFFTDKEFDVVFYLLQNEHDENIAMQLTFCEAEIEEQRQKIYQKAQVTSLDDFKIFCKKHCYDRYIPQKFLRPSSRIIPLSE